MQRGCIGACREARRARVAVRTAVRPVGIETSIWTDATREGYKSALACPAFHSLLLASHAFDLAPATHSTSTVVGRVASAGAREPRRDDAAAPATLPEPK